MIRVLLLLIASTVLVVAAPLYGEDGAYSGYASYVPYHKKSRKAAIKEDDSQEDDAIHTSAGSPGISHSSPNYKSKYDTFEVVPKKYNVLDYAPATHHGYRGNNVAHEGSPGPYAKATLYGHGSNGYKLADTYHSKPIDEHKYSDDDYKDEYASHPSPYEYGYALKDEYGNVQHRKESSDGHGKVEGTYGYMDGHGLYRSVQYVADKGGFRASVKTNEPGVENQNPADVHIEAEETKY